MSLLLEHPEIGHIERTGYPSWMMHETDGEDYDREFWGDDDPWEEHFSDDEDMEDVYD